MKIKGVLGKINDEGKMEFKIHDFEHNNYKDIHTLLDIECFGVVTREIGGKYYDVYLDDNGALYEYNIPAMINFDYEEIIYGNVFICNYNEYGGMESLSESECINILNNVKDFIFGDSTIKLIVYNF